MKKLILFGCNLYNNIIYLKSLYPLSTFLKAPFFIPAAIRINSRGCLFLRHI